jgi:hypothetical protein
MREFLAGLACDVPLHVVQAPEPSPQDDEGRYRQPNPAHHHRDPGDL